MKSEKIFIAYSFIACLFLMIVGIFSARTSNQLLASFIYLPLVFFFGTRIFHYLYKPVKKIKKATTSETVSTTIPAGADPELKTVADKDKRLFLQLIGTTGLSLLIMSLFSKRARDTFLGGSSVPESISIKDKAGNVINPAEKIATDGYSITDIDDKGPIAYYAFVNNIGAWYIMQNNSGTFRYAKGDNNYSANWNVREKLRYDYYNNIFMV